MPNWNKQTNLLRDAETLDERIEILKMWADQLDHAKLVKYLKSSFRTLNNPRRYKYFMQFNTTTHEKFLTFLIILKLMCKRAKDKDYIHMAISYAGIDRSKEWLTLYYTFKVFLLNEKKLSDIKIQVDEDEVESLKYNASNGGSEFRDYSYYDHIDIIKDCLKRMKKGTLLTTDNPKKEYAQLLKENSELKEQLEETRKKLDRAKVSFPTQGDIVADMYERRNNDDDEKPKKRKRKFLTKW